MANQSELTAEKIFARNQLRLVPFEVPEWGGTIYIQELQARDGAVVGKVSGPDGMDMSAIIETVTRTVCNSKGERLFNKADDKKKLGRESYAVVQRIFVKVMEVCATSPEGLEEEKND